MDQCQLTRGHHGGCGYDRDQPQLEVASLRLNGICAALNATLIASTMARKCAVVSVRVCDVQPPLASTELQAADACCIEFKDVVA